MDTDDYYYLFILLLSIAFGYLYKDIKNKKDKKNIGTLVGLFVVIFVSGFHVLHCIVTVLINSAIILLMDKR